MKPGDVWWFPKDWLPKVLWTLLFVSVASFVVVLSWVHPLSEEVPVTVERVEPGSYPEFTVATYSGPDRQHFPFLKQVFERVEDAGGAPVDTILPERTWNAWLDYVAARQPGADPRLVTDGHATYRITERAPR